MSRDENVVVLFDIDGTLTPARGNIAPDMLNLLKKLQTKVVVGFVGGSDLAKQKEQIGKDVLEWVDFSFSENGLVAYKNGQLIHSQSISKELSDEFLKELINFVLHYIADLDIPIKRGTFVEYRTGMINVSPIGRNCSQEEREAFALYDEQHQIRAKMVQALVAKFGDTKLSYSIGGQISIDIFPKGWDKTYCLRQLGAEYTEVHFFGDKTEKGGNDHEIYEHERTNGHKVTNPADTAKLINSLWGPF